MGGTLSDIVRRKYVAQHLAAVAAVVTASAFPGLVPQLSLHLVRLLGVAVSFRDDRDLPLVVMVKDPAKGPFKVVTKKGPSG